MCESFFAALECELLDRQRFATPAEARLAVFDFIVGWYNPCRRHSALDYLSPHRLRAAVALSTRSPSGVRIDDRARGRYLGFPLGVGAVRSFESSSLSTKPGQLQFGP